MTKNHKRETLLNAFHTAALVVTTLAFSSFFSGCAPSLPVAQEEPLFQAPPIIEQTLAHYSNVTDTGLVEAVSYGSLRRDQPRIDSLTNKETGETVIVVTDKARETYRVFTTLDINGCIYPYYVVVGFDGDVHSATTGSRNLDQVIRPVLQNPPDFDRIVESIETANAIVQKEGFFSRTGLMKTLTAPTEPRTPEREVLLNGIKTKGRETQVREVLDYTRPRHQNTSTVVITTRFDHPALPNGLPLTITLRNGLPPKDITGSLMGQIEDSLKKEGRFVAPETNSRTHLIVMDHLSKAAAHVMLADFETIAYQKPIIAPVSAAALKKDMDALLALTQPAPAPNAPQKNTTPAPQGGQPARLTR